MNSSVAKPVLPIRMFLVTFTALSIVFGLLTYTRTLLVKSRVDPTIVFGGKIPQRLQPMLALKVAGGNLFQYFDAQTGSKIAIVQVAHQSGGFSAVSGLMNILDSDRLGKPTGGQVEDVILKYAGAQFAVLSAGQVTSAEIELAGKRVPIENFVTTNEQNYLMGLINADSQQVFFLAQREGAAVSPDFVSEILLQVQALRISLNL